MSKDNRWQYGDIEHLDIEFGGHPVTQIASDLYARLGKPRVDTLRLITDAPFGKKIWSML